MTNLKKKIGQSIFLLGVIAGSLVGQKQEIKTEALATDLFFSGYYSSGSTGGDIFLEIYNGTGITVDLSGYSLVTLHNGRGLSSTPDIRQLNSISLPNKSTLTITNEASNSVNLTQTERNYLSTRPYLQVENIAKSNVDNFTAVRDGNDSFILRKGSDNIDVFAMVGIFVSSPGWVETTTFKYGYRHNNTVAKTQNITMVRRPDVFKPQIKSLNYGSYSSTISFDPLEWGVYPEKTLPSNVYTFALYEQVDNVIAMINNLPTTITQNDAEAVAAARAAYELLSVDQQAAVTNYADLQADEAVIAGFAKIIEVIELIDAIPDPLTLADESFVTNAKTAYDALTEEEKLQVTNREELTDAMAHINNLKAVQQLITDINALPSVTTLAQATAIVSIREDYEALSLVQQGLITNYDAFVLKETEYFRLKGINDVEVLIDALPVPVALTDGVQLANARTAYNLLPSDDQGQVGNYALLTTAENHYLNLQAAQVVIDQIDDIADPITLASRDAITAARSALGLLTSTQQDLVSNQQRLIDMEAIITALLDEVDEVINAIDALPDPISITNQAQLINAETAFDALSDDQEALVTNEPDLIKARQQMDAILAKIQEVIGKIDLIVDPVTLAQTTTIETARAAYNALTEDEQALVTNEQKLLLAEAVIIDLNTPRYVVSYVVFNQIFSEVVKSGTTLKNIPTSVTRLGYTFGGWVLEGTTTLLDLSTYIVTSGQRLVALFNLDPTSNQSELLIEIEGLNNIDVETLFPNRDVSLQLNIDLLPGEEVPVVDATEINDLVSTQTIYTANNIFFLDLSIIVTYVDNGISVEETLPEINEPVEITVSIPELFRAFASYQVVRVHEGVSTFLDTVYDVNANSVTFNTDKFSTYGVLYSNAITDDLIARIDAIPVPATLADLASIQAIRSDFDHLTAEQKLMITNLQLLIDAENALQGLQDDIDAVIALIALIEDPVRILDEAAIEAARLGYDELDPLQQALVTNRQDLFDAENDLDDLLAGINDLITRIDALADPIRIADQATVAAIRTSFQALTAEQQGLVTNAGELTAAENAITALLNEVNRVKGLIDDLNDPTLLADEAAIDAARAAYDALTSEQKTYIDNVTELTNAETRYQTLLDEIDTVNGLILALTNPTTLASGDAIVAARTAYDALTEEQKLRVLNYTSLTNAETDYQTLLNEIEDVIALILNIDTPVMIADEAEIEAVRAAYDALTIEQQGYVTNVNDLEDAETDLATLYAEIDAVNEMIAQLNDPITLEDDAEVVEAKEAYDLLTDEQKTFVIGLPILADAVSTIEVLKADINAVIALIADFDDPITISQETAIQDARMAYDALTEYERTFVENYQDLLDAEFDLANLYEEIALVNQWILDLNNPITIADDNAILELREAYDALTAEQQTFVLNVTDLTDAEAQLSVIIARIDAVIQSILDFHDPIRIADEDEIEAVREAYLALSELERTYVTNIEDLVDAEQDLATLYAEILFVNTLILGLNDPINLDDEEALAEAREAYDGLTLEQQTYVINFPSLLQAETAYQTLLDAIDAVNALIAGFPNPITLDDLDLVAAARDAYEDLNALQQARVSNLIDLINAETRLIDLAIVELVSDTILVLPHEEVVTLDHQAAIEAAREAYDALTTNQKSLVDEDALQHLIDAENALRKLLNPPTTLDFFSLLPYHVASGFLIMILFFIKSKKQGA